MKKLLMTYAPLCLVLPFGALAQSAFELDDIIVSATIEPQSVNRTGAIVDVVDVEDLEDAPLSVAGALNRLVGTSLSANGGLGANTTFRLRGLDGRYQGVRIDGIDVSDPSSTQTQFNFGGLTGAGLGRIEVVRGSQSALYGSEAVAGVIDISTFELGEDGSTTRVGIEGGSFGTVSASVGHAIRDGNTALSFNLSRIESDGFSRRSSDDEEDGFTQTLFTAKGQTEVGDGIIVGGSILYRDAEVEIDQSTSDPSGDNFTDQRGARLFTQFSAGGIDHEFSVSKYETERRDPGGFTQAFDGDRTQIAYLGTTELSFGTLSFGLDRTKETFETSFEDGESVTQSALVELLNEYSETVSIASSLRYDDNDDFGSNLSGRVALAWRATPDMTVRAVAGNGFRAPSLFERFSGFGDTGLKVEQSRSFELGVERFFGDTRIEATAFYIEIEDLIQFDSAATGCAFGPGCYNQVPGTTVSQGLEFAAETALTDNLTLFGTYTYTDAKTEEERLVRVPRHDISIGLESQITDRFAASATISHAADIVPSIFAPADNKVGDYTLVDAGLSYAITDEAEGYLRVENLFDEDYETAGGFNMPGRAVYVGIRAEF